MHARYKGVLESTITPAVKSETDAHSRKAERRRLRTLLLYVKTAPEGEGAGE